MHGLPSAHISCSIHTLVLLLHRPRARVPPHRHAVVSSSPLFLKTELTNKTTGNERRIALWERRLSIVVLMLGIWLTNIGFLIYGPYGILHTAATVYLISRSQLTSNFDNFVD